MSAYYQEQVVRGYMMSQVRIDMEEADGGGEPENSKKSRVIVLEGFKCFKKGTLNLWFPSKRSVAEIEPYLPFLSSSYY